MAEKKMTPLTYDAARRLGVVAERLRHGGDIAHAIRRTYATVGDDGAAAFAADLYAALLATCVCPPDRCLGVDRECGFCAQQRCTDDCPVAEGATPGDVPHD